MSDNTNACIALNEFQQALAEVEQWHETHDARVDEIPRELVSRLRRATCEAHAANGEIPAEFDALREVPVRIVGAYARPLVLNQPGEEE